MDTYHALSSEDQEIIQWEMEAIRSRREEKSRAAGESSRKIISLYRSSLGVAAGFSAPLDAAQGETIDLYQDDLTTKADEVIAVSGESMEPTFEDRDLVLVQHTQELREGEIGVFLVDGEGYIKEFCSSGLFSHNPAYAPMMFSEHSDVRVLGRVLGKVQPQQIPVTAKM